MFKVEPNGIRNFVNEVGIPAFSAHSKVTGNVAEELEVPKAVTKAGLTLEKWMKRREKKEEKENKPAEKEKNRKATEEKRGKTEKRKRKTRWADKEKNRKGRKGEIAE